MTAITTLVLPLPPERYDVRDQREMRRLVEQAMLRVSQQATNHTPSDDFDFINLVQEFGADPTGVADSTPSVQAAYDSIIAAGIGSRKRVLYFPTGTFLMTSQVDIKETQIYVRGASLFSSVIDFQPTVTAQAPFYWNKGISAVPPGANNAGVFDSSLLLYNGGMSDLTIMSSDTTTYKIGVKWTDVSQFTLDRMVIRFHGAATFANPDGKDIVGQCTGILSRGRDFGVVRDVTVRCWRPRLIGVNPNYATLCADLYRSENWYSICDNDNGPHIEFEDFVVISNCTFDGYHEFAAGKYAYYWPDSRLGSDGNPVPTDVGYASNNLCISGNQRCEQMTAGGYFLYTTANLQTLDVRNVRNGNEPGGVYLRNVVAGNIGPFFNPLKNEALNIDLCRDIVLTGFRVADHATINLGTKMAIVAESPVINRELQPIGQWAIIANTNSNEAFKLIGAELTTPTLREGLRLAGDIPYILPRSLGGAKTAFTTEATTTSDNLTYHITDLTKSFWSRDALTVYNSAVAIDVDGADPFTISRTAGTVTFLTAVARTITLSGTYYLGSPFVTEATTTSDNANYLIADRTKAYWSLDTLTVYSAGVPIAPGGADPYTINRALGALSFASTAARVITISGLYHLPVSWGARNYQDSYNTFIVSDAGVLTAHAQLQAPSLFGTGPTHVLGIDTTPLTALVIDGAAGGNRGVFTRTASANRMFVGLSSDAETGVLDAGSDGLWIVYKDDGTPIVVARAKRNTGNVAFTGTVTAASFSGTVIAAAGTLTGTTLATNVVTSSLTSLGTLSALTVGTGGTAILKHLSATKTWDPANIGAAAQDTTTITVTGAALGDTVAVGFSLDLQLLQLTGYVSAANTVTVVLQNGTGGAINLASGTLRADVWQH